MKEKWKLNQIYLIMQQMQILKNAPGVHTSTFTKKVDLQA